ncbi:amidohydrolase family protein [Candidatus Halocynthiibacter alkanivorans]|uniref:amidohydrolase family protein n=1 Tax=Candidatus Halocynthiibacter alkanivorans TaxID=2267619 RepID=UPI00190F233B|nr:amidohydrolase family protein [Candidatus Halocynthiibacter alkanivorans]
MLSIDAHQHFWRIARGDYAWMDDSVSRIRKDYLPQDLAALTKPLGIDGTVVVQAAATVEETEFLLSLADATDWILGVVGWVDLERPDVEETLVRLAKNPRFKGIRPMLQDIPDTGWILKPAVLKSLSKVAELGLRLDALVTPRHLENLAKLAATLPDLPIAIDHCAKPEIAAGQDAGDNWRAAMARLAAYPQVHCKLSGLANEYGEGWSAQTLKPVFDHVVSIFGPDRLMWGSDWPVLELSGRYDDWFATAASMARDLDPVARQALFGGTATRFYKLKGMSQ